MLFSIKKSLKVPKNTVVNHLKAMNDIGVIMTPFGDVVTVILVVNSYVFYKVARGTEKN